MRHPAYIDSLPPCVHKDMPNFVTWAKEALQQIPTAAGAHNPASAALARGGGTGKLLLLLALLASAAAAAAAMGRRGHAAGAWGPAWLRRIWRSSSTAAEEEGLELPQRKPDSVEGSRGRHSGVPQPSELVPGRARLKALAQHQLGGTALLSGRPEVELLSMLHGTTHSFPLAPIGGRASPIAGNLGQSAQLASAAFGGAASVQLVRRWGLPTESLRMAAADLQVRPHASCTSTCIACLTGAPHNCLVFH